MKSLLRDTSVNVLANLVAAAAIYLLGVVAGSFPINASLILLASGIIVAILLLVVGRMAMVMGRSSGNPKTAAFGSCPQWSSTNGVFWALLLGFSIHR